MNRLCFILLMVCVSSCSAGRIAGHYVPEDVHLDGTILYVKKKIYAELLMIEKNPYGDSFRGIAIHYIPTDHYEWISPAKGWSLRTGNKVYNDIPQVLEMWGDEPFRRYDMMKGSKLIGGDSYFKLEWRGGIKLSLDAKFILYQEAGLFGPKERKYRIRY